MKIKSTKLFNNFNDFPDIQYWLRRYSARAIDVIAHTIHVGDTLYLCIAVRSQAHKTSAENSRG